MRWATPCLLHGQSPSAWLVGWPPAKQCQGLHRFSTFQAGLHQGVREGQVWLVWQPEGVADQAQIIGLAPMLLLMTMMMVTQGQHDGPGGPTGAGQVEGCPFTSLTNGALHVTSAGYVCDTMHLLWMMKLQQTHL